MDALPLLEAEARQRQEAAGDRGKEGGRGNAKPSGKELPKGSDDDGKSTAKAAALFGTNRQYVSDAFEIRARAERRVGELMAAQRETVGTAKGAREPGTKRGTDAGVPIPRVASLASAGIDKDLAKAARSLAALPEGADAR